MWDEMQAENLNVFLEHLGHLPFVQSVSVTRHPRGAGMAMDGEVHISTAAGTFSFDLLVKRSYLDRAVTNALIIEDQARRNSGHAKPLFLFARYTPRPTAERLAKAGVNFLDASGNIHIRIGPNFYALVLGRRETLRTTKDLNRTEAQVLFAVAAEPQAANSPVRDLATIAGVSKSRAAAARRKLLEDHILQRAGRSFRITNPSLLQERLLHGYTHILRPRLIIDRFRSPEEDPNEFVRRAQKTLAATNTPWALTGGPAAYALQHFYRGRETPLFLEGLTRTIQQELRILPDRNGPIIILRPFGSIVVWRKIDSVPVAHPWLIYAELMNSQDPRAHEAAEELRREFLPK